MSTKKSKTQREEKERLHPLAALLIEHAVGREITGVVVDEHADTLADFGEPVVGLRLSDGTALWVLRDPGGNGPGFIQIQKEGQDG